MNSTELRFSAFQLLFFILKYNHYSENVAYFFVGTPLFLLFLFRERSMYGSETSKKMKSAGLKRKLPSSMFPRFFFFLRFVFPITQIIPQRTFLSIFHYPLYRSRCQNCTECKFLLSIRTFFFLSPHEMKGGNRSKSIFEHIFCGSGGDEPRCRDHSTPKQVEVLCVFHHNLSSPMGFIV